MRTSTPVKFKVVIFAGGSAVRQIHERLAAKAQVTRVVPVSDNGGSSRTLREHFRILPVGDIRNALMSALSGQTGMHEIVRLFNWRLPAQIADDALMQHIAELQRGEHALMQELPRALLDTLTIYLRAFANRSEGFNPRGGCIGNFILVGAIVIHGHINSAIAALSAVLGLDGAVWPVSLNNDLHLTARLDDGSQIVGQAQVTAIDRHHIKNKIIELSYARAQDLPVLNPTVADAIQHADAIVFGPASFFTSLMPHLMVKDLAAHIAEQNSVKIFIGNLREGNECYGYRLDELVRYFIRNAKRVSGKNIPARRFITDILANRCVYDEKDGRRYLRPGSKIKRLQQQGVRVHLRDFEDPWNNGIHDAGLIEQYLFSIMNNPDRMSHTA